MNRLIKNRISKKIISVTAMCALLISQLTVANASQRTSYLRPLASRQSHRTEALKGNFALEEEKFEGPPDVSIIIPSRARSDRLLRTVDEVVNLPLSKEILVVVDGVDKADQEVINQLHYLREKGVRLLKHPVSRGKGAAIRSALTAANGRAVVTLDEDLGYGPKDIHVLIEPILSGAADVVYGGRFSRSGAIPDGIFKSRWSKRIFCLQEGILRMILRVLFGVRMTDPTTGYKAYRREVIQHIKQTGEGLEWETEVAAKLLRLGHSIYEVPIGYRLHTISAEGRPFRFIDYIRIIWPLIKYRIAPKGSFYSSGPDDVFFKQVSKVSKKAVGEAGRLAMRYRRRIAELQSEQKADTTIVTEADEAIQRHIIRIIRRYFPHHRVLAEESSDELLEINERNKTSPYAWAIDPIEGTKEFMNPESNYYCISVALLYNGEPIAGFVFAPELEMAGRRGVLFEAIEPEGPFVTIGGRRITIPVLPRMTKEQLRRKETVITDMSRVMDNWRQVFGKAFGRNTTKTRSTALTICRIAAAGLSRENLVLMADVKPHTPQIWDIGAASLILQKARGSVLDVDGNQIFPTDNEWLLQQAPYYTSVVAGFPEAVETFIERNKKAAGPTAEDLDRIFVDARALFTLYSPAERAEFIEEAFGKLVNMDILKIRLGIIFAASTYPEGRAGALSTEQVRIEVFSKALSTILNPARPDKDEIIAFLEWLLKNQGQGLLPEARKLISSYLTVCKQKEPTLVTMVMPVFSGVRMLPPEEDPRGENALYRTITQLEQLSGSNPQNIHWQLIIVDDGSRGRMSGKIAERLLNERYPEYVADGKVKVKYIEDVLQQEGLLSADDSRKGGSVIYGLKEALREAEGYKKVYDWKRQYVGYLDSDIKEVTSQLGLLLGAFEDKDVGVAFGSRRMRDSQLAGKDIRARLGSGLYNTIARLLLPLGKVCDTQCGFKLISREAAEKLVHLMQDKRLSFDTELLLLLKKAGYKFKEVPIVFVHSAAITIKLFRDAPDMLRGIIGQRKNHIKTATSQFISAVLLASVNAADTAVRIARFSFSAVLILSEMERFEYKARGILRGVMASGTQAEVRIAQYLLWLGVSHLKSPLLSRRIRAIWRLRDLYFAERASKKLRLKALDEIFDILDNKTGDEDLWKNAKEILTEMLLGPHEEIWRDAFERSIRALREPQEKESWIAIIEAVIPVRGGFENREMVLGLLGLLKDNSASVRESAAFIIGEIRPETVDVEPYLLPAMEKEKLEPVRLVMQEALNKLRAGIKVSASREVPTFKLRIPQEITQVAPQDAAGGGQDRQYCDKSGRLRGDYEFFGQFEPARFFTNPIDVYVRREKGEVVEKILVKGGNEYTLWAEYISQRFFALLGLPVPEGSLVRLPLRDRFGNIVCDSTGKAVETTAFAMEYMEGYRTVALWLPEELHNDLGIKSALFLSILLAERDRSPKNILLRAEETETGRPLLYHIDFGASLFSRATGGFTQFGNYLSRIQMQKLIQTTRLDEKTVVNEAYARAITDRALLRQLALCIKAVSEEQIEAIIDSAGIPRGSEGTGLIEEWIQQLGAENEEGNWNRKSRFLRKGAIETLRAAIRAGGLRQYLKQSLIQRRDDIVDITMQNNPWRYPVTSLIRQMPQNDFKSSSAGSVSSADNFADRWDMAKAQSLTMGEKIVTGALDIHTEHIIELKTLEELAIKAADMLIGYRKAHKGEIETLSEDPDEPTTKFDMAVQDFYISELRKFFPRWRFIAEEKGVNPKLLDDGKAEYVCMIDPIDGTSEFARISDYSKRKFKPMFKHIEYGTGIALFRRLSNGRLKPLISIEILPEIDIDGAGFSIAEAVDDIEGAFLNGNRIGINRLPSSELKHKDVIVEPRQDQILIAERIARELRKTFVDVSSLCHFLFLASGEKYSDIAGYMLAKPCVWDSAIGGFIAQKAGAKVVYLKDGADFFPIDPKRISRESRTDSIFAAGPDTVSYILGRLRSAGDLKSGIKPASAGGFKQEPISEDIKAEKAAWKGIQIAA